jgi:hypothetical protein
MRRPTSPIKAAADRAAKHSRGDRQIVQRLPTVQIPLDQIEPHLCTSVSAVRRYTAMFRAGTDVEPILIERSGPGYLYPFQIYNGAHRRQAASLAGRTVIDAKIVG